MKIQLFNKIDKIGLDKLPNTYEVGENIENPDGILVRSANLLETEFGANLQCIARAGAGVNNIPIEKCSEKGIVVFNTPGANANAVKELVICALLLTSRKVVEGINWAKTLDEDFAKAVEKGKAQFVGHELIGKKLGVIGLGAIGANVANAGIALGMDVYGYDPFISINAAWSLNRHVHHVTRLEELFKEVDYITIHVPSTKDTKGFVNEEAINSMKDGVRILNFARGDLVVEEAVIKGLKENKISSYVTDFGSKALVDTENAICLPHLGASTVESEQNCAVMAVKELSDYLENGNIVNSVNLPSIDEPWSTDYRVCIIHKNVPNMLAQFATIAGNEKINIENMYNKAMGDYAYTIIDTNDKMQIEPIETIDNVIRVRLLKK